MLGSARLLILIKLILLQLFESMCDGNNTSRQYLSNSLKNFISVSNQNHFAVLNCSTPDRVSHQKLDWYFQTNASSTSPRVIWQRGRSNINRYIAYSPDQYRHFLQIKPLYSNDSGIYMCIDQTTGFFSQIELYVYDTNNCSKLQNNLSLLIFIFLFSYLAYFSR